MNPEQSSFHIHDQVVEPNLDQEYQTASFPGGEATQWSPDRPSLDSDDALFARAATLMMGLPESEPEEVDYETTSEPLKYVQGVVQGQRVYIITNLLEESQVLIQPQMVWTIGRNREAALPLKDRAMSRRHAVILYAKNVGFQLIDLNSMNGSLVNGVRIRQRHSLKDGDRIRIGSTNFTFFVSRSVRTLEAIHPEVLARFTASSSQPDNFMDYSALEEPDVLFKPGKP